MAQVCAFFDELEDDGWGRVTRTHHQPDVIQAEIDDITRKLASPDVFPVSVAKRGEMESRLASLQKLLAEGVVITLTKPPHAKAGKTAQLWVNPRMQSAEWRLVHDPEFKMPAADFLALLPTSTRVQARAARATDPVIEDLMTMIEMMVADNASTGIHPMGRGAREGIGYLVHLGFMTQAQADAILE